jgi:hypothetical protein
MVFDLSLRFGDFLSALGHIVKDEKQRCNRFSASLSGPLPTNLRLFTLRLPDLGVSVALTMVNGGRA